MIILTTLLQMIAYWIGLGISVAVIMVLFFSFAWVVGEAIDMLTS